MNKLKRNLIIGSAIFFSLSLAGCGNQEKNNISSAAVSESSTVNDLYDVPAGFTKGYEHADFNTYNSPAEENGLGGSKIWIEGTIDNVFTIDAGVSCTNIIQDEDGNTWLVQLDSDEEETTYEKLEGNTVCVAGIYEGFSEVYQQPCLTMNKLYDENSGDLFSSVLFGEYEGDSITVTSDYDEETNQKESYEDWLTYQIPEIWGEKKVSSDGKYTYYYPEGGMMMLYVNSSMKTESLSEEDAKEYYSSFGDGVDSYNSTARSKYTMKNDTRDAYLDEFDGTISGHTVHAKNFICPTNNGSVGFTYCTYEDSKFDRMDDFDKILQSIVIKEKEPVKEEKKADTSSSDKSKKSSATSGELNALNSAKNYLKYSAFSYAGLIEQLEYEGYTTEESTYAVDNCGADWKDQALKSAKDYLKYSAFSYSGLIEQLEYSGFTNEEATYGVDKCGADWKEQAVECAKSYLEYSSFSHSGLVDQLIYSGFTEEQAEYGVSQNGL